MDGANSGATQRGDDGFRDHRHIDNDTVSLLDPLGHEYASESCNLILKVAVRERALGTSDRTIVNNRSLFAAACLDMTVDAIEAGI